MNQMESCIQQLTQPSMEVMGKQMGHCIVGLPLHSLDMVPNVVAIPPSHSVLDCMLISH